MVAPRFLTYGQNNITKYVLSDSCHIVTRTDVPDGAGGITQTWVTGPDTIPCSYMFITGDELIQAQQLAPDATYNVNLPAVLPTGVSITANKRLVVTDHLSGEQMTFEVKVVTRASAAFTTELLCKFIGGDQ